MASFASVRKAREIARQYPLPIPISTICKRYGIELRFNDYMNKVGACYMKCQGRRVIVVNDTGTRGRVRFSIAHELGHFFLGHGPVALSMLHSITRPTYQESNANAFAAELLMPKIVLQSYGILSVEQIIAICDVSYDAARIRAKEFGWLKE